MRAEPKRWYSNDWKVRLPSGKILLLDLSNWRERAELEVDGRLYRYGRERALSGDFYVSRGDHILARARKPSLARSIFEIEFEDRRLTLQRPSLFRRRFELVEQGRVVGGVEPLTWYSRRCDLDLPRDWPLPIQLFVFWLVAIMWNRQQAAAAG